MKIAIVLNSFPKTSETFILNKVKELAKRGYQVTIFTHSGNLVKIKDDLGITRQINSIKLYGAFSKFIFIIKGLLTTLFSKNYKVPNQMGFNYFSFLYKVGVLSKLAKYPIFHF